MTARDRTALLLLGGCLLAALCPDFFPGRTPFARDLTYLFHPMRVWTAENLQAGRMPLWNPYLSGGVPWLGQPQTGVFYPGNLVFWAFPFVGALKLFSALHFALSALGGYLWARAAGGSRSKALAAGLLWSMNGFWRARAEFPPFLAVLAWTPWLGLFLHRRSTPFLSMAGALAVAAGYWPQVLWSGVLACAAAGVRRTRGAWAAVPAAALLAAPALLPGLSLAARSARAAGMELGAAALHAFAPSHWLGLLWPWASAMREAAYTGEKFFWLGCFFVGIAGGAWAVRSFAGLSIRRRFALGGLFAAGALLSLGGATPLFSSFYKVLPVRYPAQFAFWMTGAALAAVTLGKAPPRFWRPILLLAVLAELGAYGWRLAPTIGTEYFRRKPGWIALAQEKDGRFFLTPGAVGDMRASGADAEAAWAGLRAKGLSMVPLPYHLRNLNPHGFSLNPASTERMLGALYAAPSFEAAAPLLDRLGVRWVASPSVLSAPGLALRADAPWRLYERAPGPLRDMWDPGWRAYAGKTPLRTWNDGGLLGVEERPADGPPRLLFRPSSFFVGLLLAVLAWAALLARGAACL